MNDRIVLEYIEVSRLLPYELNAKHHSDEQIEKIANIIKKTGKFDQPVVVNSSYRIIKGHARVAAAKQLGLDKIPVIVHHDITEEVERILRLSDNKLSESDWIIDNLKVDLRDLNELLEATDDFDISDIGFDFKEIAQYIYTPTTEEQFDLDKEFDNNKKESDDVVEDDSKDKLYLLTFSLREQDHDFVVNKLRSVCAQEGLDTINDALVHLCSE